MRRSRGTSTPIEASNGLLVEIGGFWPASQSCAPRSLGGLAPLIRCGHRLPALLLAGGQRRPQRGEQRRVGREAVDLLAAGRADHGAEPELLRLGEAPL